MKTNRSTVQKIIKDASRMVTILFIVHILTFGIDGDENLLNEIFMRNLLYTLIGVIVFHIVIRKIVIANFAT